MGGCKQNGGKLTALTRGINVCCVETYGPDVLLMDLSTKIAKHSLIGGYRLTNRAIGLAGKGKRAVGYC